MITLKLIGDYPPVDITFLDRKDVPVILSSIVCLLIAYYKVKRNKIRKPLEKPEESEANFKLEKYDILMQPSKVKDNTLPLVNFSFPSISFKEMILWIVLIVFYYLIFTEKI